MAPLHRSPRQRRPRQRASRLRRSLAACTAEGATAEVVAACCGGAAVTGWALHLGLAPKLVGLLGALPVAAHLLQPVGAVCTARFGPRRTALVTIAVARQAFLPLALLPWLPLGTAGRQALLLAAAAAHHGLGIVCNNAWNAWVGELVPAALRGRYFGRRTALCTVAGGAFALAAGLALDRGGAAGAAGPVLQLLAALACVAGAASVVLMARQHARPARREPVRWALRSLAAPLRDERARRVLSYAVAWNGACGLSAPFFSLYLLRDLGTGYALLAAQGAGLAAAKVVSAGAWGRAVDGRGARRVLVVCTAGLVASPLAWLACGAGRVWPLLLETAAGGALLGGQTVASFALPLAVAPERERPFYVGAVALAGGAAFALSSAVGGAVVERAAPASALRLLLAGSAVLRLAAVGAALALPEGRAGRRPAAPAAPVPVAAAPAAARAA